MFTNLSLCRSYRVLDTRAHGIIKKHAVSPYTYIALTANSDRRTRSRPKRCNERVNSETVPVQKKKCSYRYKCIIL